MEVASACKGVRTTVSWDRNEELSLKLPLRAGLLAN
jgi:hypothetical protein